MPFSGHVARPLTTVRIVTRSHPGRVEHGPGRGAMGTAEPAASRR